jgi:hypothetical protein
MWPTRSLRGTCLAGIEGEKPSVHSTSISLSWSAGLPDLLSRLDKLLAFSICQAGKLFILGHDTSDLRP